MNYRPLRTIWLITILTTLCPALSLFAQTNTWSTAANGKWELDANWSLLTAPRISQSAILVTNSSSKIVTIDSATAADAVSMTVSNLVLSGPPGTTNTLWLSNPGTLQPLVVRNGLNVAAGAALSITNGIVRVEGPVSLDGSLRLDDGTVVCTNLAAHVGATATGSLTINGGTFQADTLIFGSASTGTGTVWISGGTLGGTNLIVGSNGVGTVTLAGGLIQPRTLILGVTTGSQGTLWLLGGSLAGPTASNTVTVGASGTGALIVSNGQFVANGMTVGATINASNSLVTLTGGSAFITNSAGTALLTFARGSFTLAGATLTVDRFVSSNTVSFTAGTLHTKATTSAKLFVVGDGTQTATFHLLGGFHNFPAGLTILTNSSLTGCGVLTGTVTFVGALTNTGHLAALNGTFLEFRGPVINSGTLVTTNGSARFYSTVVNTGTLLLDLAGDADGDGFTNAEESDAGTNPLDTDSFPIIVAGLTIVGDDVVVSVRTTVEKTYQLQVGDSLEVNNWVDVGSPAPGNGNVMTLTHPNGALAPQRYYRVKIVR